VQISQHPTVTREALTMYTVISASAPRMGMFLFVVIAVQIMMAGAYIVYKKRRNSMPKKYL